MTDLPVFSESTAFQGKVVYIDPQTSNVWIEITSSLLKGEMAPFMATPETAPYLATMYKLNEAIEGTLTTLTIKDETRLRFACIEKCIHRY